MFAKDLEVVDKLRADAINVREPHSSGIRKLAAYAGQLTWMGGKFPIDIGADFTWYPALGYNTQRPISQNNMSFELSNILYNLASLYSQLAYSLNRSSAEGLKSACNYFCMAAGVVSYLRSDVIPDMRSTPPDDMDDVSLESLQHLLLAQAQECFWQKAVMDGLKDISISRLAAKVSDYYADAGEWAVKSDSISSEWIHHMNAKHHHFAAAAQYRAACECLDKRRYGEEVARLRDSLLCVNEALKESRYINKIVLGDLHGLKAKVEEDLKRAEKDNDIIYLIPVPPKSELKSIDRANMATPKVPKEVSDPMSFIGDRGEFGRPLFAKLVPFTVHVAASIYNERRDRLVNRSIVEELDELTASLHEYVIFRYEDPPRLIEALHGLVSHAEEVRQQDGASRLWRSTEDVAKLKESDLTLYNEGVQLLQSEAAEDERAREQHGTDRWRRLSSRNAATKLYDQVDEIQGYLESANRSDELVKEKLRESERLIVLLGGSTRDLQDFVPSSRRTALTQQLQKEIARLRAILGEVGTLESRRKHKVEALRDKARSDDINSVILTEAGRLEREFPMQKIEAAQFEDLFDRRLQRYDVDQSTVAEEQQHQSDLEARLKDANTAFANARKGDTSTKEREQALQKLENAYFKYKEIVSNLDVGRKFYNDLAKIVARFRDECKNFVYHRRFEASHIESEITMGVSRLDISDSLQQQRQRPLDTQLPESQAPVGEPLAAPVPTRNPPLGAHMWTPNMGIKFGGTHGVSDAQTRNSSTQGYQSNQWTPDQGLRFGGQ
ncbi:MAG: pH-response regulator protein palA/rim20 [Piccolia ochrophora]|nr:MAG: pH-response regulator protein palA/rim20 [Piccolia ochrophora]